MSREASKVSSGYLGDCRWEKIVHLRSTQQEVQFWDTITRSTERDIVPTMGLWTREDRSGRNCKRRLRTKLQELAEDRDRVENRHGQNTEEPTCEQLPQLPRSWQLV